MRKIGEFYRLRFIFNRRHTASTSTAASVEIEVSLTAQRKYFSTGVCVTAGQWDAKAQAVVNHPDACLLNRQLSEARQYISDFVMRCRAEGRPVGMTSITYAVKGAHTRNDFVEYVSEQIEGRKDIKESTRKQHRKLVAALKECGLFKSFADLTPQNIQLFDNWLHGRAYVQSTVHSYHKFLKTYINVAVFNGLLDKNPYVGIKISRGKTKVRRYLTEQELARLESLSEGLGSLEKVRDVFLFQCYTGLAYADVRAFDMSAVSQRNGRYVLTGQREKTGEDYYIVLLDTALSILRKYDYKLPLMTNQQYNLRLKAVGSLAGIEKPLTSHTARHTAACLFLNNGVHIETVAKILGHSDIKTTQIYARIVNKSVEQAFDRISEAVAKKRKASTSPKTLKQTASTPAVSPVFTQDCATITRINQPNYSYTIDYDN